MRSYKKNKFKLAAKDVMKVYKEMGLEDDTSFVQKRNGTVSFRDTRFDGHGRKIRYNFHKSGWFTRETIEESAFWGIERKYCPLNSQEVTPKLVLNKKTGKLVPTGSVRIKRIKEKSLSAAMLNAITNVTHFREMNYV